WLVSRSYVPGLLMFCRSLHATHDLHSFPTRRSSDLCEIEIRSLIALRSHHEGRHDRQHAEYAGDADQIRRAEDPQLGEGRLDHRSEEHTSELQSREKLVCRLLLEKKNTRTGAVIGGC